MKLRAILHSIFSRKKDQKKPDIILGTKVRILSEYFYPGRTGEVVQLLKLNGDIASPHNATRFLVFIDGEDDARHVYYREDLEIIKQPIWY